MLVRDIANTKIEKIDDLKAILVEIETTHRLTKDLRNAIGAIRFVVDRMIDRLVARIESDRVVGTRPNDPLDVTDLHGLINIAHTDDAGVENIIPKTIARMTPQMQNAIHTVHSRSHGIQVR